MKGSIENEMEKSRLLVLLIHENEYAKHAADIAEIMQKQKGNVCYVCLSSTYDDVLAWMQPAGIDIKRFYFIDTLSSYYGSRKNTGSCFFASSPSSLEEIKKALSTAINERGCGTVVFDSISSLLEYRDIFSILKFTHGLMTENSLAETRKLYIVLTGESFSQEESRKLVTDLGMFADSVIDIS